MEPLLAQAYEAILRMEDLPGTSLLNRQTIKDDIATENSSLEKDLDEFNRLANELHSRLPDIHLPELKERLIYLRICAMHIENEFSRLADTIQQAFMDTASRDG